MPRRGKTPSGSKGKQYPEPGKEIPKSDPVEHSTIPKKSEKTPENKGRRRQSGGWSGAHKHPDPGQRRQGQQHKSDEAGGQGMQVTECDARENGGSKGADPRW